MALRRPGVRIPLGPLSRSRLKRDLLCYNGENIKVRTGVVGHPVSELGKRGGSPAQCQRDTYKTELACYLERETVLVIVSQIANLTYCSQRRESPL